MTVSVFSSTENRAKKKIYQQILIPFSTEAQINAHHFDYTLI